MPKKVVCINEHWPKPFSMENPKPGPQMGDELIVVIEGRPSTRAGNIAPMHCYGFREWVAENNSPYAWPASHFVELDEFIQRRERILEKIVEKVPELA